MYKLTESDKQYVEKRVAEKYQQILEKKTENPARIALSKFYHKVWIHWHKEAFLYKSSPWDTARQRLAWKNCAKAIYAYYTVVTDYEVMCCVWLNKRDTAAWSKGRVSPTIARSERKGRLPESNWLLRD